MRSKPESAVFTAAERQAAWQAHVALSSRIATHALEPGTGILREAMTSLHISINELRTALHDAGPECSPPDRTTSAASVVMEIIEAIRRYLTPWHLALLDWESTRQDDVDVVGHEYAWPKNQACREALGALQLAIGPKNRRLASIAGATDLNAPLTHQ